MVLFQLVINLVLPPILLYRLDAVVRTSASDTLTRHAHAYARSLANELDLGDVLQSPSRTVVFLDAIVQGGGCSYAAIEYGGRLVGSSVAETPVWVQRRGNDAAFATSVDNVYALSERINRAGTRGVLYLGFDTRAAHEQIRDARYQMLTALIIYAAASIAAAVAFARLVSRPLTQLQKASRRAADGDPAERLGADTSMVEIVNLARDLEFMRGQLVGTAARLRAEMQQREMDQVERAALEKRLRHEQRLAAVGTFAGGLAHEFNNILLPMLLYTEEALDDIAVEHLARGNVERIMAAAVRASNVVAKMLAFTRPLGKRQTEVFDPAEVVAETLDLFRALIPANIDLQVQLNAAGAQAFGDPTLFSQVVLNLLSNAVRAMRDSDGTLSVRLTRCENALEPQTRALSMAVELRVADTGHGMSRETIEHIFEPYFTTREIGDGTGLGLSLVHGIISTMGGTITVVSELGAGAEFIVLLPTVPPATQTS